MSCIESTILGDAVNNINWMRICTHQSVRTSDMDATVFAFRLANHVYWCVASAPGRDEMVTRWKSLMSHLCYVMSMRTVTIPMTCMVDVKSGLYQIKTIKLDFTTHAHNLVQVRKHGKSSATSLRTPGYCQT